jgi:hypothetical protein
MIAQEDGLKEKCNTFYVLNKLVAKYLTISTYRKMQLLTIHSLYKSVLIQISVNKFPFKRRIILTHKVKETMLLHEEWKVQNISQYKIIQLFTLKQRNVSLHMKKPITRNVNIFI